jgi:hypothetical protein
MIREHQLPGHPVAARCLVQAQDPVAAVERVQQAAHPRGGDRQRPGSAGIPEAEVELRLARRDPLPSCWPSSTGTSKDDAVVGT